MEKIWAGKIAISQQKHSTVGINFLSVESDADEELSQLKQEELELFTNQAVEAATSAAGIDNSKADVDREKELLDTMQGIAEGARHLPDARICILVDWIRENMCEGAHLPGSKAPGHNAEWGNTRLLIFTEWEDSLQYIRRQLSAAIEGTSLAEYRIDIFHGPTSQQKREAIKRAFNLDPTEHPLRILIANDAAREGLNLQAHCNHLFHFDLPWNPSRIEQRNGRIDRKLQPADTVYCHYFLYTQRPEDRVLKALIRKTRTIRNELGSLSAILESKLADTLQYGIRHEAAEAIEKEIDTTGLDPEKQEIVTEELEITHERQDALHS